MRPLDLDTPVFNISTADVHELYAAGVALIDGRREGAYERHDARLAARECGDRYPAWFDPDARVHHIEEDAERAREVLGRRYVAAINGGAADVQSLRDLVRRMAADVDATPYADAIVADVEVTR